MATIKDVAARANVSFKTVARVLNGEPHVRPELIKRVREAVDEIGYRPTDAARSLASRKSNVIAVPILPITFSYTSRMLISLTQECRKRRHYLLPEVFESRENVLDWTAKMPVEPLAVILFPPFSDDMELIEKLEQQKVPIVRIAQTVPGYGISVPVSDYAVTLELMQHLLGLGHRRIGIIAPSLMVNATEERVQAYMDALADAGIPFDDSLFIRGNFVFEVAVDAARKLLALNNPPTAIFATSDDMAMAVLAVARELEIRVPEDLAIAGFDDNSEASKVFPALTTIHQPIEEIARVAVQAAIEGHPIALDFHHKLIVRGSTVKAQSKLLDVL